MTGPSPLALQGLYRYGSDVIYIAWEPVNEVYMYRRLRIGDSVGSYSYMRKFATNFSLVLLHLAPLALGWLPTSAIPSDLYPELFI